MEYVNPIGKIGGAPYVDGDPLNDIEGDAVSAKAWEHPMREILNVITGAGLTPDGANLAQMSAAITAMIAGAIGALPPADTLPVGAVLPALGTTPFPGFLLLDASMPLRADYPDLWAYIQTSGNLITEANWNLATSGSFSSGNGTTNFRLPDARGVYLRGFDGGRGFDPGRVFGTYQADQMQQITGNLSETGKMVTDGGTTSSGAITSTPNGSGSVAAGAGSIYYRFMSFDSANSPGARTGTETRSKNITVNYCIKY
ncbi:hypothetical protein [Thalassospira sp. MCCC 1A01428]|uniref:hypothetical protein n=1 Tax=Thalassospira sp. MCCC 1A01428 TaxID=1470575 RepID=UPI000A1EFE0A|nr:hypothetical protein [Thalassospira sp. MCCC 1A01428]OSQ41676.1 hypothetical protein THS27_18390 [Thalassospira sp. MCCC 1A01428]